MTGDPELVSEFLQESRVVLSELHKCLEEFQATDNPQCFERCSQQMDRIMGSALKLSFADVGQLAKFGKEISFKGSQIADASKLLVIHGLLSQILAKLDKGLTKIARRESLDHEELIPLYKKLKTASAQLGDQRASIK